MLEEGKSPQKMSGTMRLFTTLQLGWLVLYFQNMMFLLSLSWQCFKLCVVNALTGTFPRSLGSESQEGGVGARLESGGLL